MNKENSKTELREIAPHLQEQLEKDNGFKVPDQYFDSLEARIFSRIEKEGLKGPLPVQVSKKDGSVLRVSMKWMAAAAAITLVLGAVWFFKPAPVVEAPIASVELSEEEIENYLLQNAAEFEDEQLAMLPMEEEEAPIDKQQKTPSKAVESLEDISPEDVEHILNDMTEEELEEILAP